MTYNDLVVGGRAHQREDRGFLHRIRGILRAPSQKQVEQAVRRRTGECDFNHTAFLGVTSQCLYLWVVRKEIQSW